MLFVLHGKHNSCQLLTTFLLVFCPAMLLVGDVRRLCRRWGLFGADRARLGWCVEVLNSWQDGVRTRLCSESVCNG